MVVVVVVVVVVVGVGMGGGLAHSRHGPTILRCANQDSLVRHPFFAIQDA